MVRPTRQSNCFTMSENCQPLYCMLKWLWLIKNFQVFQDTWEPYVWNQRGQVRLSSIHHFDLAHLAGTDGAAVAVQHPDLTVVLDLVVIATVPGAVLAVRAAAVVAAVHVEAHGVVGTVVSACLTLVYVCQGREEGERQRERGRKERGKE